MWRVGVETKAEVEVGSSGGDKGGDEAGGVGDATGEGGADKSAAYSSSPVLQKIYLWKNSHHKLEAGIVGSFIELVSSFNISKDPRQQNKSFIKH